MCGWGNVTDDGACRAAPGVSNRINVAPRLRQWHGSLLWTAAAKLIAILALAPIVRAQALPADGYRIVQLGINDSEHVYVNPVNGGILRFDGASQLNANGQVLGGTGRLNALGTSVGSDAWLFDGNTIIQVGLRGSDYEYANTGAGGGTFHDDSPSALNAAGQAAGVTARFDPAGTQVGQDAWLFNGNATILIGLLGAGYEFHNAYGGTGTEHHGRVQQMNGAGQVLGATARWNESGHLLGEDAWLFNGASTQLIGLTGAGYEYSYAGTGGGNFREAYTVELSPGGQAVGITNRYSPAGRLLGQDAWLFDGVVSRPIGLSGPGYEYAKTDLDGGTYRNSAVVQLSANGLIIGNTTRFSSSGAWLGQDAWIYNGVTARPISFLGSDYEYVNAASGGVPVHESRAFKVNAAGQVLGTASRFDTAGTFQGQDVWIYNGGNLSLIGLAGSEYEYRSANGGTWRVNMPFDLNASGRVIGVTYLTSPSSTFVGEDAWLFDGTTTRRINPVGNGYENAAVGARTGVPLQLNAAGQVIGFSYRREAPNGGGQDGWFFDDATNVTTVLRFSVASDGYANTTPRYLTDRGVVLGNYELFSGSIDLGPHAFWWSEIAGFHDLGTLVQGGLSAQGWETLADIYDATPNNPDGAAGSTPDGGPLYILGRGILDGQTGSHSVFLLTASVPEPSSVALVATGIASLLARRRRRGRRK